MNHAGLIPEGCLCPDSPIRAPGLCPDRTESNSQGVDYITAGHRSVMGGGGGGVANTGY
jgi:hypothetical protein